MALYGARGNCDVTLRLTEWVYNGTDHTGHW